MEKDIDFVSKLGEEERIIKEHSLRNISPEDAKYAKASEKLADYLSADAEWRACAHVQRVLLETRIEYGVASEVIIEVAEHGNYDLVVLGKRGHGVKRFVLGSVSETVSQNLKTSFLVVPEKRE